MQTKGLNVRKHHTVLERDADNRNALAGQSVINHPSEENYFLKLIHQIIMHEILDKLPELHKWICIYNILLFVTFEYFF